MSLLECVRWRERSCVNCWREGVLACWWPCGGRLGLYLARWSIEQAGVNPSQANWGGHFELTQKGRKKQRLLIEFFQLQNKTVKCWFSMNPRRTDVKQTPDTNLSDHVPKTDQRESSGFTFHGLQTEKGLSLRLPCVQSLWLSAVSEPGGNICPAVLHTALSTAGRHTLKMQAQSIQSLCY